MHRALTVGMLVIVMSGVAAGQTASLLHITVSVLDGARTALPLPRHALLISENPATAVPRRVVTGPDGSVDVRLRPGNYTVESDASVAVDGQAYSWTQTVDVVAGHDVALVLDAANADISPASAATPGVAPAPNAPSLLLPRWRNSVVAVWTPASRASGVFVDASGLVVTSQRIIGSATSVEVQFTPSEKVAARVLVADRARDVAVLWVAPALSAAAPAVGLGCEGGPRAPMSQDQRVVTIGAPLHGSRDLFPGLVIRTGTNPSADFRLAPGSVGGPVFDTDGTALGITSLIEDEDERRRRDSRIVPAESVCEAIATARTAMRSGVAPLATRLPVEPQAPPADTARQAGTNAALGASAYRLSAADFDVTFVTPALIGSLRQVSAPSGGRSGTSRQDLEPGRLTAPTEFGDWSDYFEDVPPVLVIRVTPKFEEGFWTTVARGAAYTQGVSLPPIKHFKPGFLRMRVFCGATEVVPIHPFVLEQRVSETDAVREGLYVFTPDAIGPQCKGVRLALFSEKAPDKEVARVVEPSIVDRVWQDFAAYRSLVASTGPRP